MAEGKATAVIAIILALLATTDPHSASAAPVGATAGLVGQVPDAAAQEARQQEVRQQLADHSSLAAQLHALRQMWDHVGQAAAAAPLPDHSGPRASLAAFVKQAPRYPAGLYRGAGIVSTGGPQHMTMFYAVVRMLRHLGCRLPIEVWTLLHAMPPQIMAEMQLLGVSFHDIGAALSQGQGQVFVDSYSNPRRFIRKPYIFKQLAILSASCEQCIFLDADNLPLRDPTYLFSLPEFKETGMLLWPDLWLAKAGPAAIREIFAVSAATPYVDERSVESGQLVLDKSRVWTALLVATFMQVHIKYYGPLVRCWHRMEKFER